MTALRGPSPGERPREDARHPDAQQRGRQQRQAQRDGDHVDPGHLSTTIAIAATMTATARTVSSFASSGRKMTAAAMSAAMTARTVRMLMVSLLVRDGARWCRP